MKSIAISAATVLGLITSVAAHGGVGKYSWGGKEYPGWSPYNGGSQQTIQREYPSFNPIMTPTGTNIRCNNGGQTSQLHGTIAAGTAITAHWTQWTHAEGPVTVYMAKCPGSCANFDGSGKVWFKIDEAGLLSGTVGRGEWGNGVVLKTLKWTSTIPASLAPGNYLIRHEVLALHQANTPQFYPECAQLTVTGNGGASPSGDYLVSIPGVFSMSDPGIMVDVYSSSAQTSTNYKVPGPPVWKGDGSTPPPVTNPTTPPPTQVTSAPVNVPTSVTPPPTVTPPTTGTVQKYGQCGGIGYSGATGCVSGVTCKKINDYYSQCL